MRASISTRMETITVGGNNAGVVVSLSPHGLEVYLTPKEAEAMGHLLLLAAKDDHANRF